MVEADILVQDLPLCARPGGARQMEEHLDRTVGELRSLCEQLFCLKPIKGWTVAWRLRSFAD